MTCIFCKETDPKNIIYQTDHWIVLPSTDQTYLGRCVVVLKRHCGDLAKLKKEEWRDFAEAAKKLESAVKKAFNATMFNWACLMNDAYKNSPYNPHVHWHFRPRYSHKVEFAGMIFEDLEFGRHYDRSKENEISAEMMEILVSKIKNNL